MHIRNSLLLLAVCFFAASAATCYTGINNGDLTTTFYVEDSTPRGAPYACSMSTLNVGYTAPKYTFTVGGDTSPPTCGEMFSNQEVSYGYYECEMQPAGVAGTVTTCMVASTVKSYYEAVYIKFFGNETGRVYTGFFSGGESNPTGPVLLDFDATGKPHKYGFEWTSGYIRWYVDGKEVSSALGGKAIPSTPNLFYTSLLTEQTGKTTDDTRIPTDAKVDRNFVYTAGMANPVATFTNISYTPVLTISCDNSTGIIPGDNGWKPYDPADCDLRSRFIIYDDVLTTGWASTDSTTSDFASTDPVRTGTTAIKWDVTPMTARLYLVSQTTFPSIDYYSFEFWIYGNGVFGQQIGINMLFDDGATSPQVKINDVLDEGVQPWTWSRAVIPFSLFGVNPNISQNVRGFVLSSISTTFGGRIGIDDVVLGHELDMCANETESIYAEGPAKGFSDTMSWGVFNSKSTQVAHTGSYSIQWSMYDNGGYRLHSGSSINTNEYQGVAFWINTKELQGQDWNIAMTSPDSLAENNVAGSGGINLYKYYGGPLPQQGGEWNRVVLPFYQFGITAGTKLDGILFKLENNNYQGTLYIDDIDFIAQKEDTTSGAASVGASFVAVLAFAFASVLLM